MNKKYFSVLLMGALAVASVGTITSCKDYDDDISGLQTQIDELSKAIKDIQAQIKNGAILTSVTPVADGIKITLNENGQSKDYTITNGKDGAAGVAGATGAAGKDGKSWEIGENGNWWYNDGTGLKDSGLPSRGEKGEQGAPGQDGAPYDGLNTNERSSELRLITTLPSLASFTPTRVRTSFSHVAVIVPSAQNLMFVDSTFLPS